MKVVKFAIKILLMSEEEKKQKIQEQLEAETYLKHKRLEKIAKNSFILSKQKLEDSSELTNIMTNVKKKEILEKKLAKSSYFSAFYIKYFMYKNPDLLAFLLLQLNANIIVHPIDTIKARIQARSVTGDISGFVKNKVEKKPIYAGISYSYYLVATQAFAYTAISKVTMVDFAKYDINKREYFNLLLADIISGPFKYYLETRKLLLQLGNEKPSSSFVFRNYKKAFLPLYLRDLAFKSLFFNIKTSKDNIEKPRHPFTTYIMASFFSSILSAPLDVISTKLATQNYIYYKGFKDAISKINIEEGSGKFLSGFSMKIVMLTVLGGVNLLFYNGTLDFVKEAYSLDNVIN